MNEELFFPQITGLQLVGLRAVLAALDVDPLIMERGDCDYSPEIRTMILRMHGEMRKARTAPVIGAGAEKPNSGAEVWTELAEEASEMFGELKTMRSLLSDDADKLAYFKVAAAMMVKIVELGERAQNIRTVSTFQKRVLDVFDAVLTPEQRTRATEMLAQ